MIVYNSLEEFSLTLNLLNQIIRAWITETRAFSLQNIKQEKAQHTPLQKEIFYLYSSFLPNRDIRT